MRGGEGGGKAGGGGTTGLGGGGWRSGQGSDGGDAGGGGAAGWRGWWPPARPYLGRVGGWQWAGGVGSEVGRKKKKKVVEGMR